jgi:hypothetical protein
MRIGGTGEKQRLTLNNDEKLGLLVRTYVELLEEGKLASVGSMSAKEWAMQNLIMSVQFFTKKEEAEK